MFRQAGEATGIPWQYLYALAGRESRWNPRKAAGVKGEPTAAQIRRRAVGLFQLTRGTITDYNNAHDTSWTKADTLDAALNTEIGSWYLQHVVEKQVPTDWSDERRVALFTQAWNSGPYAAPRILESLPASATVDDVREAAREIMRRGRPFRGLKPKSYRWFAQRKTTWVKATAADYMKARDGDFPGAPPLQSPQHGQAEGPCC